MTNFELENQGLILDENTISELDFVFGSELKIPKNTNTVKHYYNQGKLNRTRNACVLFASAGAISDLTGYKFSEKELLEIVNLAEEKYGWKEDVGMYMYKGVDCLRNWWNNKFPNNKLTSYKCVIGDDIFNEALHNNHTLVVGYKTNKDYYKDSQDNGKIDEENYSSNNGGGHSVRIFLDNDIKIADNYNGSKKFNIYIHNNIYKHVENKIYFLYSYLFLKDTSMQDNIRNNIDLEPAKIMFDKGYWNGLNPRDNMTRQEVMTVLYRVLQEKGNV